jgi:hypothetical protein
MTRPRIKSRTIIVLFALAAMTAASVYVFRNKVSAAGFHGAIYTTTSDGQAVNQNTYATADEVYLSGGPQNNNLNGLPDGNYYFQVTDPSGATLLSTDFADCRQLSVSSGRVVSATGPACQHPVGIANSSNGSTPVKLAPFSETPNSGSEYKVWLIRQGSGTSIATDGMHINFSPNNSKTDNFKVLFAPCPDCNPTSLLGGRKFYDANSNSLFDDGEPVLAGVTIVILAGPTSAVVVTDSQGAWSASVPTGTDYFVYEEIPYTGAQGEPGSFWKQTSPVADAEGFQVYRGTVNGDQTGLNFGNVCYIPDAQGSLIAAPEPCDVSDTPPPSPTPTPSPTPCTDCQTATISGQKFYDANSNGALDGEEVPIEGVQIIAVLTTVQGTFLTVVTTDESGNWSLTVPVGAQYIIREEVPFTDPALEPEAYWEQTAPAADDEGLRDYSGTVAGNISGLNFGDVCFRIDADGNAAPSANPCTIWYPPPPPSP